MSTILITNAASSGVAALTLLALMAVRWRRQRRAQSVYLTVDGRELRRDEPAD